MTDIEVSPGDVLNLHEKQAAEIMAALESQIPRTGATADKLKWTYIVKISSRSSPADFAANPHGLTDSQKLAAIKSKTAVFLFGEYRFNASKVWRGEAMTPVFVGAAFMSRAAALRPGGHCPLVVIRKLCDDYEFSAPL